MFQTKFKNRTRILVVTPGGPIDIDDLPAVNSSGHPFHAVMPFDLQRHESVIGEDREPRK